MSLNSRIYVDKSSLIAYTNAVIDTAQRFVCVSRPRRFGKSVTAQMLPIMGEKQTPAGSLTACGLRRTIVIRNI